MRGAKGRVRDNFSFSAFEMPAKWLSLGHTLVGKIIIDVGLESLYGT